MRTLFNLFVFFCLAYLAYASYTHMQDANRALYALPQTALQSCEYSFFDAGTCEITQGLALHYLAQYLGSWLFGVAMLAGCATWVVANMLIIACYAVVATYRAITHKRASVHVQAQLQARKTRLASAS